MPRGMVGTEVKGWQRAEDGVRRGEACGLPAERPDPTRVPRLAGRPGRNKSGRSTGPLLISQLWFYLPSTPALAAFSGKLHSRKGTACHMSTDNQNTAFLLWGKKSESRYKDASLGAPARGCGPEPHVLGRGYRMTADDLFIFMKNKKGVGKGSQHGWDGRMQRFM